MAEFGISERILDHSFPDILQIKFAYCSYDALRQIEVYFIPVSLQYCIEVPLVWLTVFEMTA